MPSGIFDVLMMPSGLGLQVDAKWLFGAQLMPSGLVLQVDAKWLEFAHGCYC